MRDEKIQALHTQTDMGHSLLMVYGCACISIQPDTEPTVTPYSWNVIPVLLNGLSSLHIEGPTAKELVHKNNERRWCQQQVGCVAGWGCWEMRYTLHYRLPWAAIDAKPLHRHLLVLQIGQLFGLYEYSPCSRAILCPSAHASR